MSLHSVDFESSPQWLFRAAILTSLGILYVIYTRELTSLRRIPGPFLASITKLWIVNKQRSFKRHEVDIALHKKYGPIVRVAPNEVMVSGLEAFRTIYGTLAYFQFYQEPTDNLQALEVVSRKASGTSVLVIVGGQDPTVSTCLAR